MRNMTMHVNQLEFLFISCKYLYIHSFNLYLTCENRTAKFLYHGFIIMISLLYILKIDHLRWINQDLTLLFQAFITLEMDY